ncbi:MAG: NSS family neurotransmitter:Na+ symporter [Paraglaciecola sp.]|jgi:NSS family neurotransmitter:Na+ symporter
MTNRQGFSSRLGFVMAAAGSAVGLGNIWGFPTQAANQGGSAFILVYLIVILLLAVPALYAELLIGHTTRVNPVSALQQVCQGFPGLGRLAGYLNLLAAVMMLSFYSIIAGWMAAHAVGSVFSAIGLQQAAEFSTTQGLTRNLVFSGLIILLSAAIILAGVKQGIEKWSKRLMPLLFVLLILLISFILTLPGAEQGLARYLKADFSNILSADLILAAMGQAFFSLSIGVGGMMIYGSYLAQNEKLGRLTLSIAALDTSVALLAGLLIIPALYVAQEAGAIIAQGNDLIGRSQLIFEVLPFLFEKLGWSGIVVSFAFFSLLSIASLTSTISSTEVPVAYLTERREMPRKQATILVSCTVALLSTIIMFNFDWLFRLVITLLTHYMLPLMGLFYFLVLGWLAARSSLLPQKTSLQRLLAAYFRYVCPLMMATVFWHVASQ